MKLTSMVASLAISLLCLTVIALPAMADEPYCREYTKQAKIGGKMQEVYGTACMQPDGSWEIVSQNAVEEVAGTTVITTTPTHATLHKSNHYRFSSPYPSRPVISLPGFRINIGTDYRYDNDDRWRFRRAAEHRRHHRWKYLRHRHDHSFGRGRDHGRHHGHHG